MQKLKFIVLALLTTLFVSAMPLQAAYATADDPETKEACFSIEATFTAEAKERVKAAGGASLLLKDKDAAAFVKAATAEYGPPPVEIDTILVVKPQADSTITNLGFFKDGCLVLTGHLENESFEHIFEEAFGKKS